MICDFPADPTPVERNMAHPALAAFFGQMDRLVADERDARTLAGVTGGYLKQLLRCPDFLEERFTRADGEEYAQHIVHVHEKGKYSLVSLVWLPGQSTPVHDHISWCVVGVLSGQERETSYSLCGPPDRPWLAARAQIDHQAGDVCLLVPPRDDIHRVWNPTENVSISLHVYGADIAALGSSICRTYDCDVRPADCLGTEPRGGRAPSDSS